MKIVFFKSKEYPDHYFLYRTTDGNNIERMFQKFTHTGEHENSGYLHMEIEIGPQLIMQQPDSFFEFLVEQIATNHILHTEYDAQNYRAWYEFKTIDFDAWQKKFEEYQIGLKKELDAEVSNKSVQTTFNF